jgi:MFS transporter, DHA3 family, macrolide efflux protein
MSYEPPPNGFRTFALVWLTQSVSVFGSALTLFAVTIWLTQVLFAAPEQQSQLALAVSAVALAQSLPMLIFTPIAGAWADRYDRKKIMMLCDIASGMLSLTLLYLLANHASQLWPLILIVTASSVSSTFHVLAFDTSYAMLVPEQQLPRANGMMQAMTELSSILAPAIAAIIISLPALARQGVVGGEIGAALSAMSNGVPLVIAIDAVTFFLAAITLAFLYIPSPRRSDLTADGSRPAQGIWADVKDGARFIRERRPLLWLLYIFLVANMLGTPMLVFQPLLAKFNLAADWAARSLTLETALALMNSFASLGGALGGIAIGIWGGLRTRRIYGVLVPMTIAAVAEIILGLSGLLYLSVAMLFVVGVTITVMNAHTQSIWQTQTPHEIQGRVFAVRRLISRIALPVSVMLTGWVAGYVNPGLLLAVMGLLFLANTVIQFFNPILLSVEETRDVPVRTSIQEKAADG